MCDAKIVAVTYAVLLELKAILSFAMTGLIEHIIKPNWMTNTANRLFLFVS